MGISHMIDTIRKRPGMFLGSNSISALLHFLNGYQAAEREHNIHHGEELFPLPFWYMHEYTGYRLHERNSMGWCFQILNACNGEEETALQKFFEFYDEFRQVRMKRGWKAVLSEDNIAWNNQMKGGARYCGPLDADIGLYTLKNNPTFWEPIYRDPLAVYVIELTIPAYSLFVETATDIRLKRMFFSSLEKAKKSAEISFGSIDLWEEFTAQNITFDKNIMF